MYFTDCQAFLFCVFDQEVLLNSCMIDIKLYDGNTEKENDPV